MLTQFRLATFIFLFIVPVFGKQAAQSTVGNKPLQIVVINSLDFENEQQGVTKLLNTKKNVDAEFRPRLNEFTAQQKKYDDFVKPLQDHSAKNDPAKVDRLTNYCVT